MSKKLLTLIVTLPLILVLSACSMNFTGTTSTGSQVNGSAVQANQSQINMPANSGNQSLEGKLASGTLKLEGTDKAVTAEQAKNLLPLWKAVKSMASSSTTSPSEMTALYKQIQDAMTADQVQAIKDLNLSQTEMQAMMKQYNVQASQGNFPTPNATQMAQRSSSGSDGGGMPGGAPPDGGAGGPGGGMPADGGGGMPGSTTGDTGSASGAQPSVQGTPKAGQARGMGGGMNLIFVDPLIQVLQQRAGA
jgi:hypothetical protein